MAKSHPWVTGPALEILMASRAIQVGDELLLGNHRFGPDNDTFLFKSGESLAVRRTGRVTELDWDCPQNLPVLAVPCHPKNTDEDDQWFYPNQIFGWRRPRG